VNELVNFIQKGGNRDDLIVDKMLFAAMIEARSCERFKVLTENIKDEELKTFYRELMISKPTITPLSSGLQDSLETKKK
jgi:tRNA-(ms[2]io[6]A)-hydroxylase